MFHVSPVHGSFHSHMTRRLPPQARMSGSLWHCPPKHVTHDRNLALCCFFPQMIKIYACMKGGGVWESKELVDVKAQLHAFYSLSPFISGHAHLSLCCAQFTTTACINLRRRRWHRRRATVWPLRAECLASHGPSEETHAHLQQLAVHYRCGGVLFG